MLTLLSYQPGSLPGILKIPNLGVCFVLRCFQHLSIKNVATLRCHCNDNRHTRGFLRKVLSYCSQLPSSIKTPILDRVRHYCYPPAGGCLLVSCSCKLPLSLVGSDHILSPEATLAYGL